MVSVNDNDRVDFLQRATGLDRGESEAIIVVADKTKADLLLMDEIAGRRIAQNMKIPITGSACILVRAFQTGLISKEEADNAFDMIRKSRRHISERLIQNALSMIHARDGSCFCPPILISMRRALFCLWGVYLIGEWFASPALPTHVLRISGENGKKIENRKAI